MNCDRLARWYRWLEYAGFGRALERRREEFLARLTHARKILLLGDGDGRFLSALLRMNPAVEVDSVDGSLEMLALAQRRAAGARPRHPSACAEVRFHHADALAWLRARAPGGYDAICTHFFLDCFTDEELAPLVAEIERHTAAGSCWLVSEFRAPAAGLAGWCGRLLIRGLYQFFRLSTGLRVTHLPDHRRAIAQTAFQLTRTVIAGGGVLVSELWERT